MVGTFREPKGGMVVFVGAGPGDPDLLTIRGRRVIEQADLVVWADSLVHPCVAALARPDAEVIGSATLTLEEISRRMIETARAGKLVARVQSGDPAIYGAMHEQMVLLDAAEVPYAVVPATAPLADVERTLVDFECVVILKVGRALGDLLALLDRLGLSEHAVYVRRCGWPDQQVVTDVRSLAPDPPRDYFALLIVRRR